MADAFIGEIRAFGFDYAPQSWAFCNGSSVPVAQNAALYAVIGNNFGGDTTAFKLPNMQGQAPMQWGDSQTADGPISSSVGQNIGTATVTLTSTQMPSHTHTVNAALPPKPVPANMLTSAPSATSYLSVPRNPATNTVYDAWSTVEASQIVPMAGSMTGSVGGGQAHNNMSPFLALNFCICLEGEFPTRPS